MAALPCLRDTWEKWAKECDVIAEDTVTGPRLRDGG